MENLKKYAVRFWTGEFGYTIRVLATNRQKAKYQAVISLRKTQEGARMFKTDGDAFKAIRYACLDAC